jgi:hypothetical protein
MADEQEQAYTLVLADGSKIHRSRDFTGSGRVIYENKEIYEGDFVDGVRIGKGSYTYENGDFYSGGFDENRKHGLGQLEYRRKSAEADTESQPCSYHGYFANGAKHGQGTFRYSNGDIYSGEWSKGKKHGQGTYIFKLDGSRFIGDWVDGAFVSGQWLLKSGARLTCSFKYNKPTGQGQWSLPNGEVIEGEEED